MAGVGGAVVLWIYIDEDGRVLRTVLAETSGYDQLDEAAQQVASKMEWSPALNRDKKTAVWLAQAIDFSVT
jgi:protein TonB